ncbi:UDP-glucose 4-epimerase GalE [Prochlorococcus marinus XMU1411]|uniref:UDP-glucose 4-epimerase GalE n=1 Tax=Prochlorococcus marinus TaxID=1219 RepID=UPI001AD9818C|nr:UDP-glucose 4-epimerase GalE [Prochlorococcus marinus]MBO8244212.1 UDP-glucose 4-epimerase GalE [Prochlorococcus marinus XMU1411]MBW3055297.1 UDP-glucose 4-epimerase GalE [Prochlorococcus marinus str. MU1411]MCR8537040.1 UDP-glucose 4-epimerase GalE [Prochlorococcus marinus CUG1430]
MNILIIGGAGYIGSQTTKAIKKKGYYPIVLDNLIHGHKHLIEDILKVPLIVGQAGDKELLKNILLGNHPKLKGRTIDAIIHLAAFANIGESMEKPAKYYRNNLGETLSILEVLIDQVKLREEKKISPLKIPFVFSSTCATFGVPELKDIPISENNTQNPINPYGRSKLMIEKILEDFHNAYEIPSISLRYFNAAGADPECELGEDHNPETHLIPLILDALGDNENSIKVFGRDYPTKDGTCIRDFIHVYDLAEAHVAALEKIIKNNICDFYNLGTGKGYSVIEVIETCKEVTGLALKVDFVERRLGDPPILIASPKKIMKELQWRPVFSDLETIIRHAWRWYLKNSS